MANQIIPDTAEKSRMNGFREWKFKALTPIWTGDADRQNNRLIPTGIMGSIRWWFEFLIRGLGGSACDPTVKEARCPSSNVDDPFGFGHHCVACELFGCTGWARKFRLQVVDGEGHIIRNQIQAGDLFTLRFIPLRPINPEEWCLLDITLRLIAEYGAIGGKTVYKPTDERARENCPYHWDYGLIKLIEAPALQRLSRDRLESYVRDWSRWRNVDHGDFAWVSLENFWCVKGRYLARQSKNASTFNRVIGRKELKNRSHLLEHSENSGLTEEQARWLAGGRGESKKVFSFKNPEEARRTFGFVRPGMISHREMKNRLKEVWEGFKEEEFKAGEEILNELLSKA